MTPILYIMIQAFMVLLFATALLHKAAGLRQFVAVFRDYRIVPQAIAKPAAYLVLLAEAAAVFLLILRPAEGAILAASLLAAYALGMGINIYRGRTYIDCGCHWQLQKNARHAISHNLIIRNMGLAALVLVLYLTTMTPPTAADYLLAMSAGLFFFAAYMVADILIMQARMIRQYKEGAG